MDRSLEKVRKLLALATSTNRHEAALAAKRAQEIMARYNIDMSGVSAENDRSSADRGAIHFRQIGEMRNAYERFFAVYLDRILENPDRQRAFCYCVAQLTDLLAGTGKQAEQWEVAQDIAISVHEYRYRVRRYEKFYLRSHKTERMAVQNTQKLCKRTSDGLKRIATLLDPDGPPDGVTDTNVAHWLRRFGADEHMPSENIIDQVLDIAALLDRYGEAAEEADKHFAARGNKGGKAAQPKVRLASYARSKSAKICVGLMHSYGGSDPIDFDLLQNFFDDFCRLAAESPASDPNEIGEFAPTGRTALLKAEEEYQARHPNRQGIDR